MITRNSEYLDTVRSLSDQIVQAQGPIRILDAIKWDDSVREAFFAKGCKEQPTVDASYYAARPLPYDAPALRSHLQSIHREIGKRLGEFNPISVIMRRICREYETVIRMLEARGTEDFSAYSQQLYGSASDAFHAGDPTLADLGIMLTGLLNHIGDHSLIHEEPRTITGVEAVEILGKRLENTFRAVSGDVRVIISDGIVADAAAGAETIKIRREARFNERDLKLLEVHEGWVHVGTTLNGNRQPYCTFLSKGPPSSTVTQEGLAMLLEILAFASYPSRVRRLTNRVRAVLLAEEGATFVDVFRYLCDQGVSQDEAYHATSRVFRGSTPTLGPFTKDISYSKGFILIYSFILLAVRKGLLDRIPLLFCGKTNMQDLRALAHLIEEGVVKRPEFVPPQFADLHALTAWMCYSNFITQLTLERIEADFSQIL